MESLKVVPYFPHLHYAEAVKWWEEIGWTPIGVEQLPENGRVVENVCAGWVYRTDSSMAVVDWIISNPKAGLKARHQGLELLIPELRRLAIDVLGFKICFTFVHAEQTGLRRRLEKHGFQVGDKNLTTLACI